MSIDGHHHHHHVDVEQKKENEFLSEGIELSASDSVSSADDVAMEKERSAVPRTVSQREPSEHGQEEEDEERPRSVIPQKVRATAVSKQCAQRKSAETKQRGDVGAEAVTVSDLETECLILGGTTIGKEAELRLQMARCKAMESRIGELLERERERERTVTEQQRAIKELEGRLKAAERERDGANRKLNVEKKQSVDLVKRCKRLEAESHSVSSDLREFKKGQKAKSESMRNAHIRLNRALEDAEKWRNLYVRHKDDHRNHSEVHNQELVELKKENRVLIKHKNELLAAFRKQLKLIDILKKQKVHLEAAKVLQFAENTFAKALDIGHDAK